MKEYWIYWFIGQPGAGKTTLSGLISTLHPLSSGFILFNDKSIYENLWSGII